MHAQTFISVDAHIKGQIYEILREKNFTHPVYSKLIQLTLWKIETYPGKIANRVNSWGGGRNSQFLTHNLYMMIGNRGGCCKLGTASHH